MPDATSITQLLHRARAGDRAALEELLPLVYEELRGIARRENPVRGPATLNTTAIVNEAYVKLFGRTVAAFEDRRHFYSIVCLAMRQILRDHARRRGAAKRGGSAVHVELDERDAAANYDLENFLALDEALDQLRAVDPRLADVVELRYLAGLSVAEVAELRECTERTVLRDWRKARAFLQLRISPEDT